MKSNTLQIGSYSITGALTALTLIITYIAARFVYSAHLDAISPYGSYFFEVAFVAIATLIYKPKFSIGLEGSLRKILIADLVIPLSVGLTVFLLTTPLGLTVPFELKSAETLFFLLLAGPILEELVFRFALWQPIEALTGRRWAAVHLTTALFSFAHFYSYFFVPAEFRPFIIYQSIYVIWLGYYCAIRKNETNSVRHPTIVHLAFNMGFFLGSLLLLTN